MYWPHSLNTSGVQARRASISRFSYRVHAPAVVQPISTANRISAAFITSSPTRTPMVGSISAADKEKLVVTGNLSLWPLRNAGNVGECAAPREGGRFDRIGAMKRPRRRAAAPRGQCSEGSIRICDRQFLGGEQRDHAAAFVGDHDLL